MPVSSGTVVSKGVIQDTFSVPSNFYSIAVVSITVPGSDLPPPRVSRLISVARRQWVFPCSPFRDLQVGSQDEIILPLTNNPTVEDPPPRC